MFAHDHENSEPIPVSSFDCTAVPILRKVMTSIDDESLTMQLRDAQSPRSATQLAAVTEEHDILETDEVPVKESKYLCHHKACNELGFCVICKTQARHSFAQKHLFKSGMLSDRSSKDDFSSEKESDDEQSCHEADLTDPVSNQ